ncbi:MAG: hypothetical protein WC868_07005 [Bacteroidales bacterium]
MKNRDSSNSFFLAHAPRSKSNLVLQRKFLNVELILQIQLPYSCKAGKERWTENPARACKHVRMPASDFLDSFVYFSDQAEK